MRKTPEVTSRNVKRFTETIYVGKRKEMRSFCLENGNLSRQMNKKTVHNDVVIICWKGMLRCSSQHSRNLFTVQKDDLGWILGKTF